MASVSDRPDRLSILHVDAERGFSGGEVQVLLLMEGLRRRGHHGALVCPPASRFEQTARERGFPTHPLAMRGDLDLAAVARLRRVIEEQAPDLVHLHTGRASWLGGLAARWAGRPAVTTRRMDRAVRRGWKTRLVYEHLVRRVVAISPAVARELAAGGVPPARVSTIASSVEPPALPADPDERDRRRRAARAALGLGPDERVVLVLAALVPRKGIDVLLEALAGSELARTVLLVAGEGEQRGALEARAAALGLGPRVRFLGQRDDKERLLEACDVFCLPSRQEGLGVAALEAMAAGRAVVASRVGGLAEAVEHERSGLLVPPGDPRALARALARLLDDPALRERLAAHGPLRVAEGFLAEQMVAAYERLYRAVLREGEAA